MAVRTSFAEGQLPLDDMRPSASVLSEHLPALLLPFLRSRSPGVLEGVAHLIGERSRAGIRRRAGAQLVAHEREIGEHVGERIVDLVGNAGREHAHGLELLLLAELGLERPSVRHVVNDGADAGSLPVFVGHERASDCEGSRGRRRSRPRRRSGSTRAPGGSTRARSRT